MKGSHLIWVILLALVDWIISMPTELFQEVTSSLASPTIKCYACTSYASSCKERVDESTSAMPHVSCKGSCFLRQGYEKNGKELALYRGCSDDFESVSLLDTSYLGCRKQEWNGVVRIWCFCGKDKCNMYSIEELSAPGFHQTSAKEAAPTTVSLLQPEAREANRKPETFTAKYDDTDLGFTAQDFFPIDEDLIRQFHEYMSNVQEYALEAQRKESEERKKPTTYEPPLNDYHDKESTNYNVFSDNVYTDDEEYDDNSLLFADDIHVDNDPRNFARNAESLFNKKQADYDDLLVSEPHQARYSTPLATEDNLESQLNTYESSASTYESTTPEPELKDDLESRDQLHTADEQDDLYKYHYETVTGEPTQAVTPKPVADLTTQPDKIICSHTGFIPNPSDCSTFLACILDAHLGKPVMHRMRCPEGLYWDNTMRICVKESHTCKSKTTVQLEPYRPETGHILLDDSGDYDDSFIQ